MNAGLQGFPAEHCILMRSVSTFNDAAGESLVHLILTTTSKKLKPLYKWINLKSASTADGPIYNQTFQ